MVFSPVQRPSAPVLRHHPGCWCSMRVNPSWPSPAKLNLFLHITGRRQDGYHDLQTCFQLLDYGDEMSFESRRDGVIRRVTPNPGVPEKEDLVVRAASLLRQKAANDELGVDIHLQKRLPMGAGLGGGSSNAATTLLVLNQLWVLGLGRVELAELGEQLGADVAVFIHGHSAMAGARGDELQTLEMPQYWYLVLTPPVHVSTREIFQAPELTRDCPTITICDLDFAGLRNVCEPTVIERYPEVGQALDLLAPHEPRMSGTGASVFARFDSEREARVVENELSISWPHFVAMGVNESPLEVRLREPLE